MKRLNLVFYFSIVLLIFGGFLFIKANRHEGVVNIIENLKDKSIVFYSSNFKRVYAEPSTGEFNDMDKMCMEGADILSKAGLDAGYLQIEEGNADPYTLSGQNLEVKLQRQKEYILIDILRGQTRHGRTFQSGEGSCCPISIIISEESSCYDQSLLFAGRVKTVIDKHHPNLPVQIITTDEGEYNQGRGYIGMLVEMGDSANKYEDAKRSLKIFCNALIKVINERE